MGKDDSPNSLLDMAPTDEKSTEKEASKSLLYEFDWRFDKLEGQIKCIKDEVKDDIEKISSQKVS